MEKATNEGREKASNYTAYAQRVLSWGAGIRTRHSERCGHPTVQREVDRSVSADVQREVDRSVSRSLRRIQCDRGTRSFCRRHRHSLRGDFGSLADRGTRPLFRRRQPGLATASVGRNHFDPSSTSPGAGSGQTSSSRRGRNHKSTAPSPRTTSNGGSPTAREPISRGADAVTTTGGRA